MESGKGRRAKSLTFGGFIIRAVTEYVESDRNPETPIEAVLALHSAIVWVLANMRAADREKLFEAYMALAQESWAAVAEVSAEIDQRFRH